MGLYRPFTSCESRAGGRSSAEAAPLGSWRHEGHEGAAGALAPVICVPKGVTRRRRAEIPVAPLQYVPPRARRRVSSTEGAWSLFYLEKASLRCDAHGDGGEEYVVPVSRGCFAKRSRWLPRQPGGAYSGGGPSWKPGPRPVLGTRIYCHPQTLPPPTFWARAARIQGLAQSGAFAGEASVMETSTGK